MEIEGIGIIGANKQTAIFAHKLALKGFQVRIYDSFKDSLNLLMSRLKWSLERQGKLEALSNVEAIQDYSKFKGADLIIETLNKTFEERYLYFSKILKEVDNNCIIAINSSIPIISSFEKIPFLPAERVVGINFSMVFPYSIIEIAKTQYTELSLIERIASFIDRLGSKYVIISDKPGGILMRLNRIYINSAFTTLFRGKGFPNEIDSAIKELTGSSYGPFEFVDILGIDYDYNSSLSIYEMLGKRELYPHELELKLLQYGQLGKKSNLGIYIYEDGNIVGENPILPNIIKYLGLKKVDNKEIFSDIMIPILNEAKEIAKEIMVGEQDIENVTKFNFGWSSGIFGMLKKYPDLFVVKEKSEFDNLDTF
ncbi:MAG: hypothetical protein K6357_01655 [Elusimicrobiota bacterium]